LKFSAAAAARKLWVQTRRREEFVGLRDHAHNGLTPHDEQGGHIGAYGISVICSSLAGRKMQPRTKSLTPA
jgi:hypothetical protein